MDATTREAIGRKLRAIYEEMPKGAIPERLWLLLLAMEKAGRRP